MLLLCRQQSPDISDNYFAVVDLKNMPTPTADKSVGGQSEGKYQAFYKNLFSGLRLN